MWRIHGSKPKKWGYCDHPNPIKAELGDKRSRARIQTHFYGCVRDCRLLIIHQANFCAEATHHGE